MTALLRTALLDWNYSQAVSRQTGTLTCSPQLCWQSVSSLKITLVGQLL